MKMLRRSLLLFLPFLALGQAKKPVTLEAIASYRPSAAPRAIWSPDGARFLYRQDGKLRLYDAASQASTELLDFKALEETARKPPPAGRFEWQNRRVSEEPVQWMPDGKSALLAVEGDLFLFDIASKKWTQLTATPIAERDPKPSPDGKHIAFRLKHDLHVMDVATKDVRQLTRGGSENLLNGELDWVYPEELDLGTAYWWAPDSTRLAYLQFDTSPIGTYPHADLSAIPAFAEPQKYPHAGTPNSNVRLGIVAITGGETKWMKTGEPTQLLARVHWSSGMLLAQRMTRIQDRLDMLQLDPATGEAKVLFTETDPAWINISDDLRVLDGGKKLLWSSERTGFRHLYLLDVQTREFRQITQGDWEVSRVVAVDEKAGNVWYLSTEASPLERHLYSIRLDGRGKTQLTREPGTHSVSMPARGGAFLDTYSNLKTPPETTLHAAGKRVAVFQAAKENEFDLRPVEIVTVKAPDGDTLYARLIRPADFDATKKYPAVVMVYGGPHAQTVRDAWAGPNWEQVLAARGFVVWGLDNRGSGGRGHKWESKLYRRFGKQELEDQKTGLRHLLQMGFVDPARVGMYGWSYGGYMTLYSLLNEPDLFAAGVAGAPVTDWRLYDTIYTERYLGLPQENETGYRDSSAITYAANLKAKLLLVHCYGDDNVLFQNSFQMAAALQKAGRTFEMMIYPDKSHGVTGPGRAQLSKLMTEFFERTLKN
jgi:dipeptidyl-peptidase-4